MVWYGNKVNIFEKNKASFVATQIKYNEKPKGAEIIYVNGMQQYLDMFYSSLEGTVDQI